MSLSDLIGSATRTGALKCQNCGEPAAGCQCRNCPIRQQIHTINGKAAREQELMRLLRIQTMVLGLITSKRNGKCIGFIDRNGAIKHCDGSAAVGPYHIIMKNNRLFQNLEDNRHVLGQCVDKNGHTMGEIIRKNHRNYLVLTKKSQAPVIATLSNLNLNSKPSEAALKDLDHMIRESKALIENSS
jgi:hypothetical protein